MVVHGFTIWPAGGIQTALQLIEFSLGNVNMEGDEFARVRT